MCIDRPTKKCVIVPNSEDADQFAHQRRLIKVLPVYISNLWILSMTRSGWVEGGGGGGEGGGESEKMDGSLEILHLFHQYFSDIGEGGAERRINRWMISDFISFSSAFK